jgi:hypothetical protein
VPRARIVECDRAKAILSSNSDRKPPQNEATGHVRPGLQGHFIVVDVDVDEDAHEDAHAHAHVDAHAHAHVDAHVTRTSRARRRARHAHVDAHVHSARGPYYMRSPP